MPLVVYKSSAGSGKTTTLVQAYLKITLNNPSLFKHVLAITFTNKAANEMKERVLNWLKLLSDESIPKSEELNKLRMQLGFSDALLRQRAKKLFSLIIHNYDDFSISTIDSFVYRIIKTFTNDVKLPQNFEVVIEEDELIPEIIKDLYEKVGAEKDITDLLVNFVLSNFEDEKTHDPTNQLYSFIQKQIKEEGFFFIKQLQNKSLADFQEIILKLQKQRKSIKTDIKKQACSAIDLIEKNGIEHGSFFRGKTGIFGYFQKNCHLQKDDDLIPNKTARKSIEEDNWYPKNCPEDQKRAIDRIKASLQDNFNTIIALGKKYILLNLVYSKIYDVALIREIRALFDDYINRNQKVHISEFNKKISDSIAGQPVPFIYERLGRRYRYFLIDEFQDTSILQWQNLLPLIEESLAYNNENMLVGDAKQAIYRFRNGEVELFSNLPDLYPEAKTAAEKTTEQFLKGHYDEVILDRNYRSEFIIVDFNNRFFESVKNEISQRNKEIYKQHKQCVPEEKEKSKRGYVKIDLVEAEKIEDYRERRLVHIRNAVDELKSKGYANADICVLTNQNKYAAEIASFLIEKGYETISHESLLLKNSPEVRLVITMLKLLINSEDRILMAAFIENMLLVNGNEQQFHQIYSEADQNNLNSFDEILSLLGYQGIKESEINTLPVYEMVEYAISKLFGETNNNVFLHFFLDFVYDNQQVGDGSVQAFIDYWDNKCENTYITMPDGLNAIQVMTIHKAKGLKFESVIIDLIPRNNKTTKKDHWIALSELGFNELNTGMIPITEKSLEHIGLQHIYKEECEKTELDLLNLIYVAFTRPVSAMYIISQKKQKSQNRFTTFIQNFLDAENINAEALSFKFGELNQPVDGLKSRNERNDEIFELKDMISAPWQGKVNAVPADPVFWEQIESKPARVFGKLMHSVLSEIYTSNDIERVLKKYQLSGILDETEKIFVEETINKLINHNEIKKYFSGHALVKNETELVVESDGNKILQRPDRVVYIDHELAIIDYKTGEKIKKDIEQINEYADYFNKLGYQNIKKYLIYLNGLEIMKV